MILHDRGTMRATHGDYHAETYINVITNMVLHAPQEKPEDHGFKPGDFHLIANAETKTIVAYNSDGGKIWEKPCLCDGQHANWRQKSGDTPPGLYKLGAVYDDYEKYADQPGYPPFTREHRAYGWYCVDMEDLEGNEDDSGRAGICIHGGGSALGWPGAWARHQKLVPTIGCIRMHNADLYEVLKPMMDRANESGNTVFVSVYQDDI